MSYSTRGVGMQGGARPRAADVNGERSDACRATVVQDGDAAGKKTGPQRPRGGAVAAGPGGSTDAEHPVAEAGGVRAVVRVTAAAAVAGAVVAGPVARRSIGVADVVVRRGDRGGGGNGLRGDRLGVPVDHRRMTREQAVEVGQGLHGGAL